MLRAALYEQTITETERRLIKMTMRKNGVVLPEFLAQGMKRLFWLPIARDKSECPIGDLLFAGEPFVGPGERKRCQRVRI